MEDFSPSLDTQFSAIINNIGTLKTQLTSLQQEVRSLEKNINKQMKTLKKENDKNKSKQQKGPSGFAKPANVSSELCKFLNKEEGTKIARTDVAKALTTYIKTNNLQFSENKQIILPDENLKSLLGIKDKNEKITFFNIQKYMNKHFIKDVQTSTV
jgi:chromatin remodeling complex protein RSC6